MIAAAVRQAESLRGYRSLALGMRPVAYYRMGEVDHGTMRGEHVNALTGAPFDAAHHGDGSGANYGLPGALAKDNDGCVEYLASATSGNYGGAGDYSLSFASLGEVTVSCWVWHLGDGYGTPACRLGTGLNFNYRLFAGGSSESIGWNQHDGTATLTYTVAGVVHKNSWHNVVGVRQANGLNVELFVDGESVGSTTMSGAPTVEQGSLQIGSFLGYGQKASGKSDEMKIFHRALTATEIKSLFLIGRHGQSQHR